MPKILKKFEHKAKVRTGSFASKYDWKLYLSGQNVQLSPGEDFPTATDEEEAQYAAENDGASLRKVRKTNFITTLKSRGHDENKNVKITELDDGDLVVTAVPMTPEEIEKRKADLERRRAEKAATAAANGKQEHAEPAVSGVAPE